MFHYPIDDELKLVLLQRRHAEELKELIDSSREHLAGLDWVESTKAVEDTRNFIEYALDKFAKDEEMHCAILYNDKIAGVTGLNQINRQVKFVEIGYWLGRKFTGNGIMTRVVNGWVDYVFKTMKLDRIEIYTAYQNKKSRAVAQRAGFEEEAVLKKRIPYFDEIDDMVIYTKLRD
mgnify:FL=1